MKPSESRLAWRVLALQCLLAVIVWLAVYGAWTLISKVWS
jgi:hypothetical protein